MLELKSITAGYGSKRVLESVSLNIRAGEIVALLGPNGAGKSTILKVIAGLVNLSAGDVLLNGKSVINLPTFKRVRLGMELLMQNAPVFESLSVSEHYRLANVRLANGSQNHRSAGILSGGERHRLAADLCLSKRPQLLLFDEPSAGVSPAAAQEIYTKFREYTLVSGLQNRNVAILVVEQNLQFLPDFATRIVVLRDGKIYEDDFPLDNLTDADKMFSTFYG